MLRMVYACTLALLVCSLATLCAHADTNPQLPPFAQYWTNAAKVALDAASPCADTLEDWGDAPEYFFAYPGGPFSNFPTCGGVFGAGTQELSPGCGVRSTPPVNGRYVRHVTLPGMPHFWLGCWPGPTGPGGIDSEADGKMNGGVIFSACDNSISGDCIESAFSPPRTFDQDECFSDVVDHGVPGPLVFTTCTMTTILFDLYSCAPVQGYLNILVDWNKDTDWNDVLACADPGAPGPGCAYEWAVKNAPFTSPGGCTPMVSPPFLTGPNAVPAWLRITVTLEPVSDNFPWEGSFIAPGFDSFQGGETEDYPVTIEPPVPTERGTWGKMKATYR